MRCKHGFPQAFAFDPLTRAPWMVNGAELPRKSKLESGLFRLSCPMLVRAIDEWEGEGAVRAINDELREQPGDKSGCSGGGDLAAKLEAAHVGHAAARREIIGERLHLLLDEAAATGEEQTRIITTVLESGIAGQTRSKVESLHRRKTSGPELSPVSVLPFAEEPPKTKLPKALQDFHFKTG
jgi:hypothetical protein